MEQVPKVYPWHQRRAIPLPSLLSGVEYRYLCVPQSFHASNDVYIKRFDDITRGFPRVQRCVDDSVLWYTDIKLSFWHTMRTLKYLQSIRQFPSPTNIPGVRLWFGLVNQASYAFAQAEVMAPFRELLKHSTGTQHWKTCSNNLNSYWQIVCAGSRF